MVENEFDWPACSWATGYLPNDECLDQHGPKLQANSFYSMMVKRNACMRGQVQNIAVNGARSSSFSVSIIQTTAGNGVVDEPALVLLALSANDVCNPHPYYSHMTTPAEWIRNNLITLRWLDDHLAPGSDVIMVEMMHGAEVGLLSFFFFFSGEFCVVVVGLFLVLASLTRAPPAPAPVRHHNSSGSTALL
jgi:hypothetical protein